VLRNADEIKAEGELFGAELADGEPPLEPPAQTHLQSAQIFARRMRRTADPEKKRLLLQRTLAHVRAWIRRGRA
jgi:hypothetical protein